MASVITTTKEQRYEQVLRQIAEGDHAVPGEAWRHVANDVLREFGVSAKFRQNEPPEWPTD